MICSFQISNTSHTADQCVYLYAFFDSSFFCSDVYFYNLTCDVKQCASVCVNDSMYVFVCLDVLANGLASYFLSFKVKIHCMCVNILEWNQQETNIKQSRWLCWSRIRVRMFMCLHLNAAHIITLNITTTLTSLEITTSASIYQIHKYIHEYTIKCLTLTP